MVQVTQAVKDASVHLKTLIPTAEAVALEEVEISADDQFWLITLSFIDTARKDGSVLVQALGAPSPRAYRVLKLNRQTGELRSMKIRELQHV